MLSAAMRRGVAWGAGVCLALAALLPTRALGQADGPTKERCVSAYVDGQRLRKDGALLTARQELILCASEACPQTLRQQCGPWLDELERSIPSVVFAARDAGGQDTTQVRVARDGEPWLEQLPTQVVDMDPGQVTLLFTAADGLTLERTLVVREGEQNRVVEVDFSQAAATASADLGSGAGQGAAPAGEERSLASRLLSVPVLIAAGVSVAGLGSFAGFGLSGKLRETELAESCAPACEQSDVDDVRTRFLIADISLGAALLSVGLGALFFLLQGDPPAET